MTSSETRLVDMPHIHQDEDWDCGLTCAKMILRCFEIPFGEDSMDAACRAIGINKCVWTIDLAHLMSHHGIKHEFFTITLGVDPSYKDVDFYTNEHWINERFSDEEVRINELFKCAADKGIVAMKRSLGIIEITAQLEKGCLAIVLIDASIIDCVMCSSKQTENSLNCCPTDCLNEPSEPESQEKQGYVGHFIVVCGYDSQRKIIFYKDPGKMVESCQCSFDNFDAARKSHGTDEDILFVQR